jgi:hypothetical protein
MLLMLGPLLGLSWLEMALDALGVQLPLTIVRIAIVVVVITWILHLLYASLRIPGKRTAWDRFAGVIVRYRR